MWTWISAATRCCYGWLASDGRTAPTSPKHKDKKRLRQAGAGSLTCGTARTHTHGENASVKRNSTHINDKFGIWTRTDGEKRQAMPPHPVWALFNTRQHTKKKKGKGIKQIICVSNQGKKTHKVIKSTLITAQHFTLAPRSHRETCIRERKKIIFTQARLFFLARTPTMVEHTLLYKNMLFFLSC